MKKTILIFFIFKFVNICLSQTKIIEFDYKIEYIYQFKYDSNDSNSYYQQKMELLTNKQESYFLTKYNFIFDSILFNMKDHEFMSNQDRSYISKYSTGPLNFYALVKQKDKNIFYYSQLIHFQDYVVKYKGPPNYKLVDKDTIIMGYKCKQATCYLGGRNYFLWYTPEIPISDGPYKFSGLPGLVLKVFDTKKEHFFFFQNFEKRKIAIKHIVDGQIETTMKNFLKIYTDIPDFNNPSAGFTLKPKDPAVAKQIIEKAKKNNNFIELKPDE